MIPGAEGIFSWTPPGAAEAALELGREKADDGTPVWPRFHLERITGLGGLGEAEDTRDRPPGAPREIARRSLRRGKSVVFEGTLRARDLLELREAEALFRAAFDDISAEGRMDAFWHPLLLVARPGFAVHPPKFFEGKVLTAEIPEAQAGRRFWRNFVVGIRLSDRRYFDEESESHTVEIKTSMTKLAF